MKESVIAVVFDFDGTLGPDTIASLLAASNVSPSVFWDEVAARVLDGWDPPLAYMQLLLTYAKEKKIDISTKRLQQIGASLQLYPGLPKALEDLKKYVTKFPELRDARVKLEYYIISGGIEEMIRGTALDELVDGIFGSTFYYEKGKPVGIKTAISFTEKTRYLYGINKGVSGKDLRSNPYKINDAVAKDAYRIPFQHMIYIGDGPSDIPCLSAVAQYGGTCIGVSSPEKTFHKGYELAKGKRITVGPYTANYKRTSDMRKVLEETILRIGLEIAVNKKKHVVSAPAME